MDDAKPHPDPRDYHEGRKAAENFIGAVKQILSVSPAELKKRHKEWEKKRKSHRAKAR
jgi:hypothetical protein